MCEECSVWECGIARAAEMLSRTTAQMYLCELNAYVSILPAFIPVLPANLSVSARVKQRPTLLCVGCRHLSVNISHFLSLFFCLSLPNWQSEVFAEGEKPAFWAGGLPAEREARSPSISVGIWDCRRTDKMPSGQRCVLRQTEIWRPLMSAVEKLYLEQTQPC